MEFVDLRAQRERLGGRCEDAIARVLEHGQFVNGPEISMLETRLAAYAGVAHAVSCASGTDAIVLALLALGMAPGDHVVVPTFTFAATAEAVALLGGVPVFVDVDPTTFNLDPRSVEEVLDGPLGGRIAGIVAVELFGHPAPHDEISVLSAARDLWVVTDAAQSFGASWRGKRSGSVGTVTTTSFFPAKPLGCYGDGGAVFTDDGGLAEVVKSLRNHGQGLDRYDHVRVGMTGRLDTIQAAVLLEKLDVFDEELMRRQAIAGLYDEELSELLVTPQVGRDCRSAWAQYTCRTPRRDELADALRTVGIPTAVHYPLPLHRQPAYREFPLVGSGAPVADEMCRQVLSLPVHPYLRQDDQDYVCAAIRKVFS